MDAGLTIIGTGHVFKIEDTIRDAIHAERPDVVFVELDKGRLQGLLHRQRGGSAPEAGGFVHKRLQRFQESIAGQYGATVGSEMLAAAQAGQAIGAKVALIDPPAEETLRRVMKELTLREKLRMAWMMIQGRWKALRAKDGGRKQVEDELTRYQNDPESMLDELGEQFPTIRRIVIDERDERMAKAINNAMGRFPRGVAVLGDGHVGGVLRYLQKTTPDLQPTVYRLADVREGRLPKPAAMLATGDTKTVTFGFTVGTR